MRAGFATSGSRDVRKRLLGHEGDEGCRLEISSAGEAVMANAGGCGIPYARFLGQSATEVHYNHC